jgi:regulator of sirC expression with transglutaminase-like and TPR domain
MPAYCHPDAYDAFAVEMPQIDTMTGLFRAAFAIARHEHPSADVAHAEATIAELADIVRRRVRSSSIEATLAHLHDVLFDIVGFVGNVEDYYDPENSYLPEVLRTHRGLPITLALIYKSVAERVGLVVCGINSPGHFLVAVRMPDRHVPNSAASERWMYVDPFYGGGMLDRDDVWQRIADATGREMLPSPELLARATHRQWIARMLNNLQAVFAHTGRERDLYAMQELQDLLAKTAV